MRYSSLFVAASALAGFAAAQNSTQFNTPIPCCSVSPNTVDQNDRQSWCQANQNTCVELCGGPGKLASNGNKCDPQTLDYSCNCRNGSDVTNVMDQYQQTVPGQMCRVWYSNCISASGTDATQQFECEQVLKNVCGNKTVEDATNAGNAGSSSAASSGSPSATSSGSSGSATGAASGSAASPTPTQGAAANLAFYGTSALAGGLFALFGMAL